MDSGEYPGQRGSPSEVAQGNQPAMAQVFVFGSFSEEEAAQNQFAARSLSRSALSAARPEMPPRPAGTSAKPPQALAEQGTHRKVALPRPEDFQRFAGNWLDDFAAKQDEAVVRDKVILEVRSSSNPDDSRASPADLPTVPGPLQDGRLAAAGAGAWSAVPMAQARTGDIRAAGGDGTSLDVESRNPPSTQSSLEARYGNGALWDDGRLPPIVDKLPLPAEGPSTSASVQGAQPLHHPSVEVAPSRPAAAAHFSETIPAAGPSSEQSGASADFSTLSTPPAPPLATASAPVPPEAPAPRPPPKPSSWAALLSTPGPAVQASSRKDSAATPSTHVPAAPQQPSSSDLARGPVVPSSTPQARPAPSAVPSTPSAAPLVAALDPEAAVGGSSGTPGQAAALPQQAKAAAAAPAATDPVHNAEPRGSMPTQFKGLDVGVHRTGGVFQGNQESGEGALGPFGPRGFENGGNLCFANATLQALLGSSSFIQLLDSLHQSSHHDEGQCPTVSCFVRFWRELHGEKGASTKGRRPNQQIQKEPAATPNGAQGEGQGRAGKATATGRGAAAASGAGVSEGTAAGAEEGAGAEVRSGEGEADAREGEEGSEEAQELDDASLKLLAPHLVQGSMRSGTGSGGAFGTSKEGARTKAGASGSSNQGSGSKEAMSYAALAKAGRSTRLAYLGPPLDPSQTFEDVLARFSPQHHLNNVQIRQEDAQEFLSYLLDRMHEELLNTARLVADGHAQGSPGDWAGANGSQAHPGAESPEAESEESEADGWETVGKKNKMAITRLHAVESSDVSSIFFGQLRSEIKTQGAKASATVQPFSVIQLDIARDSVRSVEDALIAFGAPEYVEGYRPQDGRGSHPVMATKVVRMQALPRVLILHLMRFTYSARGSMKLHKSVSFPLQLTLSKDLVYSPPAVQVVPGAAQQGRTYKLFATVVHHGKEPSRGHYTANVRQPDDTWLRFDDASVAPISAYNVAREQAYLLLYERT